MQCASTKVTMIISISISFTCIAVESDDALKLDFCSQIGLRCIIQLELD